MLIDGKEWRLVPAEPTDEMRLGAWLAWKTFSGSTNDERMQAALREAIADAPTPPAVQDAVPDDERAELIRLRALVNSPLTADFLAGVQAEAAHQIQRWGDAHDRSKSAENWFWLVGYLAGKCLRAHVTGDKEKALHHTISAGAALAQWHAAIERDVSGAGIGQDADLARLEGSPLRDGAGND